MLYAMYHESVDRRHHRRQLSVPRTVQATKETSDRSRCGAGGAAPRSDAAAPEVLFGRPVEVLVYWRATSVMSLSVSVSMVQNVEVGR